MMQGDTYWLPFVIRQGSTLITPDLVDNVELAIGSVSRFYPNSVEYSTDQWQFPLTQDQSFSFPRGRLPVQVRVQFKDGSVVGGKGDPIDVRGSVSRYLFQGAKTFPEGEISEVEMPEQLPCSFPLLVELRDVVIGVAANTQERTVTPSEDTQIVRPDPGYNALSSVIVEPIPKNWGRVTYNQDREIMIT